MVFEYLLSARNVQNKSQMVFEELNFFAYTLRRNYRKKINAETDVSIRDFKKLKTFEVSFSSVVFGSLNNN